MNRIFFRWGLILTLVVVLLIVCVTFIGTSAGLDKVVRPLLVSLIASRTGAAVTLERLERGPSSVFLRGFSLTYGSGSHITISEIAVDLSLGDLLKRRLGTVSVIEPDVELVRGEGGEEKAAPVSIPERPPVMFDKLLVRGGRILSRDGERRFTVQNIELDMSGLPDGGFHAAALLGDGEGLPLRLVGMVSWEKVPALEIREAQLAGRKLLRSPLRFAMAPTGASGTAGLRLDRIDQGFVGDVTERLGVGNPVPAGVTFALAGVGVDLKIFTDGFRITGVVEGGRVCKDDVCVSLKGLALGLSQVGPERSLSAQGGIGETGTFRVQGSTREADGSESLDGTFHLGIVDAEDFLRELGYGDGPGLSGGVNIEGRCTGPLATMHCDATLAGTPPEQARTIPSRIHLATLDGFLALARKPEGSSGRFTVKAGNQAVLEAEFSPGRVAWTFPEMSSEKLVPSVVDSSVQPSWVKGVLRVRGTGNLRLGPQGYWSGETRVSVGEVTLNEGMLNDITLEIGFGKDAEGIRFHDFKFSVGTSGDSIPTGAWKATGSGRVNGEAFRIVLDQVGMDKVEYLAEDGLAGLSGGTLLMRVVAERPRSGAPIAFDLTGTVEIKDVLAGELYVDLTGLVSSVSLSGHVHGKTRALTQGHMTIDWGKLGSLVLTGSGSAAAADVSGEITLQDLKGLASRYLLPAVEPVFPSLKDMTLAGTLGAVFRVARTSARTGVRGHVTVGGVGAVSESLGISMAGATGTVPFDVSFSGKDDTGSAESPSGVGARSDGERGGELAFEHLALGPAELRNRSIAFKVAPDRFTVNEPIVFSVAGGTVGTEFLTVERTGKGIALETRMNVENLDLDRLTSQAGIPRFSGTIGADLGTIRYADDVLASDGSATIAVFGGNIAVSNLYMEKPFSRYRTIHADVDFSGMDLYSLSHTFEFGEMHGVADGYVHNLRMFGSVPSHFSARLLTRDEGKRDISVKALNNISLISQGGVSAALSRGIYRFIDFYRYRRIGIEGELENDVFQLRGIAAEGSDRYLVYGSFIPPRIDITAPARAISFKELVKRMKRIDRTGGRTKASGSGN